MTSLTPTSAFGQNLATLAAKRTGGIKQLAEGRSDIFQINPLLIEVEDGFNVRDFETAEVAEHIDGLAKSIAEIGIQRPLTVRNKGGRLLLKDGECRLRATIRAIDVYGAEIATIPVKLTARSESDADSVLGILTENSGLALTPLGKSSVIKRLKGHGWTDQQIADRAGMSKQRVTQLLDIAGLSTEVKALIKDGTVSSTTALSVARANGFDDSKTADALAEGVKKAASTGKARVTAKTLTTGPSLKAAMTNILKAAIDADQVETVGDGDEQVVNVTLDPADWEMIKTMLRL
jgi:ParB/RepB/Spo0J family partition protein